MSRRQNQARRGTPTWLRGRRQLVATALGLGALAASFATGAGPAHAAPSSSAAPTFTAPKYLRSIGMPGDAFVYPWGMATETVGTYAGDIVVSDYNNYNVKVFSPSGTLQLTIGTRGSGPGQLGQPYGVAVDPNDGSIYVADLTHQRIEKFDTQGVFQYAISPPSAYYAPYVAVNSAGDVFITQSTILNYQTGTNQIFEYDNAGNPITTYVGTNGTSCAAPDFGNVRGIDVDASGLLYVADTTNHCIQVFNTTTSPWTFVTSFGNSSNLSGDTRNLTIDRTNGFVYVADALKNTVAVFSTWNQGTGSGGVFQGTIGTPGPNEGQLGGARGVAIGTDANATVYVSDYTYWRINAYDPLFNTGSPGAYLYEIPNPPVPPPAGGFNNPTNVAVSTYPGTAGDVYVADTFNQRIQQFDSSGNWLAMWGSRQSQLDAPYALDYPRGVAVDPTTGNVWVNDTRSGYIKEYSSSGTFITEFGGQGSAVGQFFYSVGISSGPTGLVYVTDSDNDRLQVLNPSGAERPGFPVTCGTGIGFGSGGGCTGVTVDASGNIYAAAEEQNQIDVFKASGKKIGTIGSSAPRGTLNGAYDVAIFGTTLYVTDAYSNRISEFKVSAPGGPYPYLGTWGISGTAPGDFTTPLGISVDSSGNIYVVDYGNARVEVFAHS